MPPTDRCPSRLVSAALAASRRNTSAARYPGFRSCGSVRYPVTTAADELGVSSGAVTQQVRILERHLGVRLDHGGPEGLQMAVSITHSSAGRRARKYVVASVDVGNLMIRVDDNFFDARSVIQTQGYRVL